jgi:hypothetical protein
VSENYVCFTELIPSDMTDEDIESRHVLWNKIAPPSPVSKAEADRRLAEDPFCEVPDIKGKEEGASLDFARRWVEEEGGIAMRALLKLLKDVEGGNAGAIKAFELIIAGLQGKTIQIPNRAEVHKGARPSLARDATKRGRGARKRLAAVLDLTPARITQLAQIPPADKESETTEFLEEAALLLEREKQAFLTRARACLSPSRPAGGRVMQGS